MSEQTPKEHDEMWENPHDKPPAFYVRRELLEVKSFAQRVCYSNIETIREPNIFSDHITHSLLLRIASKHVGNYEFVSPLNWFEHVKERLEFIM